MGSFRSTRTCDESPPFADTDAITETTESSQFVPKSRWRHCQSVAYDAKHMEGGGGLCWGSGRLVPAWEFLAKNWQKAWRRPDGGASRRRHVPKLPSEGGQRTKKCRADILQVAKVEEHIRRALQLLGHYAPISISRQNREFGKVLHRDCKAKRK